MIWDVYFFGTVTVGLVFGCIAVEEVDDFEHPYLMVLGAFFGWPLLLPFILYDVFTMGDK